jgi:hypothetical protein
MKTIFFSLATVALLTLQSCQSDQRQGDKSTEDQTEDEGNAEVNTEKESPTKMIELLVGEWERAGGGQAQNNNQQDIGMQRIRFTQEARYISYDGNQKVDSGAYRMNEQLRNLYLESVIDKEPKEYEVELSDNQLTMKRKQAGAQSGETQYVYRRRQ